MTCRVERDDRCLGTRIQQSRSSLSRADEEEIDALDQQDSVKPDEKDDKDEGVDDTQ